MSASNSPLARRRRVGAELRRLREVAGKTIEEVAAHLECSSAKVSRIETGSVSVRPLDAREMLELYGVAGARQDALVRLVRQTRHQGWWHSYGDVVYEGYEIYVGLEDEATTIWTYEAYVIPGLLQTRGYALALSRAYGVPPETAERYAGLRTLRQALLNREDPPQLWVVIEDAVLRRPTRDPEIMREQLRFLATATAWPNVTIQVLPLSAGLHAAQGRAFILLGFANPADPKVVYTDNLTAAQLIDTKDEVDRYAWTFDTLRELALPPDASADLIGKLARGESPPS